jgi:Na+/H+ antiporter NhaD/arsenite permease-like protein
MREQPGASGTPHQLFGAWLLNLARDPLLLVLAFVLVVLTAVAPHLAGNYVGLIDWDTLGAMAGLLALSKGLELSGALQSLGDGLLGLLHTERTMALGLVTASALLSMLLTNDVALFVLVPLTLGLCRRTALPATRLIIFEALAVNAGSMLTPIGNPQNLFLWQRSGVSSVEFIGHMLPLVTVLMLALLALTAAVFSSRKPLARIDHTHVPMQRGLFAVSLLLYLPFLLAAEMQLSPWAAAIVLVLYLCIQPRVLARLDWSLLLVFALMFIDLRLIADLPAVRQAVAALDLSQPLTLLLTSVLASQIISNVPAAIALAEYTGDWRVLAYGVNIGGFGFMVGSLANLIALRMTGDRRAWWQFHVYALPFLLFALAAGKLLLPIAPELSP